MLSLTKGRYGARLAQGSNDLRAAQQLRSRAFGLVNRLDRDEFDDLCQHILIEDLRTRALVC